MARPHKTGRFRLVHREKNENIENYEKAQMQKYRERYKPRKEYVDRKRRNYLRSPDNLYKYHADTSLGYRDLRNPFTRALYVPYVDQSHSSLAYEPLYRRKPGNNRKALIIGERPSLWKGGTLQRPELPGNLFLDNLKYQDIDWTAYTNITWNQILESHKKDIRIDSKRYAQSLPQKEAWLASIDPRYDIHRQYRGKSLPQISPRLFKPRTKPDPPPEIKYKARDGLGATYYLEGSGDVTNKAYSKVVFPEITPRAKTPERLNF